MTYEELLAERARRLLRRCLRQKRRLLSDDVLFLVRWCECVAYRDLIALGMEDDARAIVAAHRVGR